MKTGHLLGWSPESLHVEMEKRQHWHRCHSCYICHLYNKWQISSSVGRNFSMVMREVHHCSSPTEGISGSNSFLFFFRAELLSTTFGNNKNSKCKLQGGAFSQCISRSPGTLATLWHQQISN